MEVEAESSLVIEVRCADCGKRPLERGRGSAFMEMKAGPDGVIWHLCLRCWLEGLYPNRLKVADTNGVVVVEPPAKVEPAKAGRTKKTAKSS